MDTAIREFRVNISDEEINDLRLRLAQARWPDKETVSDWSQGIPLAYTRELCDYWAKQYDMQRLAKRLNAYSQYLLEIDGVDIHFLHVRSPHPNAKPLILTHGWPGSVVEFLHVIDALCDPVAHGGAEADAFHVVCPSLPGYGFSGKPQSAGWGVEKIASVWDQLMQRIGYPRYLAQGGDWGAVVTGAIGELEVSGCVGLHLNMVVAAPHPEDPPSERDQDAIAALMHYDEWDSGYSKQQSTRPQTLAYGLADSPSGQLAWIIEKFWSWTDCADESGAHPENAVSRDDLLDNVMVYWLTNSAGSSARLYWQSFRNVAPGAVSIPVAASIFPKDIFRPPRRWVESRFSQLVYWGELDRGGHFAALERPGVFVEELRRGFGSMSIDPGQ